MLKTVSKIIIVLALFIPLSSNAAEQVSPVFNDLITYFPLADGKAMILSGEKFYQANQPTQKDSWQETNLTYQRTDNYLTRFDLTTAVPFKGYDYVVLSTDTGADDLSWDVASAEIWRLSRTDPTVFEQVVNIDNVTQDGALQFVSLARYQGALYAAMANGSIWKTNNGTNWESIDTIVKGLPEEKQISSIAATAKRLYMVVNNAVYRSADGKSWHKMSGNYLTDSSGAVAIAAANQAIYITSTVNNNIQSIWQKKPQAAWVKILDNQLAINNIYGTKQALYIAVTNADNTYSVLTDSHNETITSIYNSNSYLSGFVKTKDESILVIVNENDVASYLVKFK
ncbi:MAG: hypothetical protein WCW27_00615 [Patescibacteria group bacterium]|jgi:hypothetical protein